MSQPNEANRLPGVCIPWEEYRATLGDIPGNEELVKTIWEQNDFLGYMFIWHCLLSF